MDVYTVTLESGQVVMSNRSGMDPVPQDHLRVTSFGTTEGPSSQG